MAQSRTPPPGCGSTATLVAAGLLLLGGCSEGSSEEVNPPTETGQAALLAPAEEPTDDLERHLFARADELTDRMEPATEVLRGNLDAAASRDHQAVFQGGRCYKILGVGGPGVEDLDVVVFDNHGTQLQRDSTADAAPVIGQVDGLCPDFSGAYRLRVHMTEGSGEYAVRVYRSLI